MIILSLSLQENVRTLLPVKAVETLPEGAKPLVHSDRGCHYRWPGWDNARILAHFRIPALTWKRHGPRPVYDFHSPKQKTAIGRQETEPRPSNIIQIDQNLLETRLDRLVAEKVTELLNAMLDG